MSLGQKSSFSSLQFPGPSMIDIVGILKMMQRTKLPLHLHARVRKFVCLGVPSNRSMASYINCRPRLSQTHTSNIQIAVSQLSEELHLSNLLSSDADVFSIWAKARLRPASPRKTGYAVNHITLSSSRITRPSNCSSPLELQRSGSCSRSSVRCRLLCLLPRGSEPAACSRPNLPPPQNLVLAHCSELRCRSSLAEPAFCEAACSQGKQGR